MLPSQKEWETPLHNPVLKAGDLLPKALWNDPTVIKANGVYVMWMTTSTEKPFQPPILPFRAVSSDAKSWRLDPQTPVATPAGTPFASIETPSVVRFGGRYHMYFSGIYPNGKPALMAIGHAVSVDGKSWTVSPAPVLSATGNPQDWNGVLVGEPGAIVHGDQIFVYFSALAARAGGNPPQDQTIGLAKTSDGEHFQSPTKVLAQSPLYPAAKGFVGYSAPSAFELNGSVHLLYDVALYQRNGNPEWQQVAVHHAVSADGETNFIQDDLPLFTRNQFPMARGEIIGPTGLVDDGYIKIWFAGHVPVSQLGPLINRGFSGEEFGIYYVQKALSAFH
jgi:hypothetical protein